MAQTILDGGGNAHEADVTSVNRLRTDGTYSNLEISKGNVAKHDLIVKFGENQTISTATDPEDVWDQGGLYTFTANGGADYYVSSSDNTDTQPVLLYLLTEDSNGDWNNELVTVTLTGQTKKLVTTTSGDKPVRIYRALSLGSTDFAGDVYVYEDDTVTGGVPDTDNKIRAKMLAGENQTLMAIYTVPSNTTAYLTRVFLGISKVTGAATPVSARFSFKIRPFGGTFLINGTVATRSDAGMVNLHYDEIPIPIPAKSDMLLRAEEVSATTGVFGGFNLILVED